MWLLFNILFYLLLICIGVNSQSIYEDCPRGTYRHSPFSRECKLCAKGHYGNTHGLTVNTCSAPCPLGRYGNTVGVKTIDDCKLCPPGTIGSEEGLSTSLCSRNCPQGRYSSMYGATSVKDCQVCPTGYFDWQCYKSAL